MFTFLLKIFMRTGLAYAAYPFLLFSPLLFIFPYQTIINVWIFISVLFMQRTFLHPLHNQLQLTKQVHICNYPVKYFLRLSNIILGIFINIWFIVLMLILLMVDSNITLRILLASFFFLNLLLCICYTTGNKLEVSTFMTVRSSILRKISRYFIFYMSLFLGFVLYELAQVFDTKYYFFILLIMYIISITSWYISINKYMHIKYYLYL
jgi:hypothetical protein